MNEHPDWTGQARAALEQSAQALDAAAVSRLNQARQRALDQLAPRRRPLHWTRRLAVAASLVLALALLWPDRPPTEQGSNAGLPAPATLSSEDAELLAEGELEMTDELEFYAWLDAQDEHNG